MSYQDDNELVEHQVYGLKFMGTYKEQRDLTLALVKTKESRAWGVAKNLLAITDAPVPLMAHQSLAEQFEDAESALTKKTHELIEAMIAARGN